MLLMLLHYVLYILASYPQKPYAKDILQKNNSWYILISKQRKVLNRTNTQSESVIYDYSFQNDDEESEDSDVDDDDDSDLDDDGIDPFTEDDDM